MLLKLKKKKHINRQNEESNKNTFKTTFSLRSQKPKNDIRKSIKIHVGEETKDTYNNRHMRRKKYTLNVAFARKVTTNKEIINSKVIHIEKLQKTWSP